MGEHERPSEIALDPSLEQALRAALDATRRSPATPEGAWLACAFGGPEAFPAGRRGQALLARALAVVGAARPSVITLVFRRLKDALTVAGPDLEQLEPAPVRSTRDSAEGILVRHLLGARELTAHVRAPRAGVFDLTLDLWGSAWATGPRVTLTRGGRELVSEVSRAGRTYLPGLAPGRYRVAIAESGVLVGELDLTFEDTAA